MRAIDADALLELLEAWKDESQKRGAEINYMFASAMISQVNAMPTIEPEIVRCKDCKYWQDQQEGVVEVPICARPENKYEKRPFRFMIGEDGFCSFAERSEEQE